MKIGLDWDGTVSADPTTFREVVVAFLNAGHEVAVTTWRCSPLDDAGGWSASSSKWEDIEEVFEAWGFRLPVFYCNGNAKRDFYDADIWIDDNPSSVSFSLTRPPRFEADPSAYLQDVLVCKREGFDNVELPWGQLKVRL